MIYLVPLSIEVPTTASLSVKILAYANDTLVYLRDANDFCRLHVDITVYMQASSASLNYHKTVATSLSGKTSATLQSLLTAHSITAWYDQTSATPSFISGIPSSSASLNAMLPSKSSMAPSKTLLLFTHSAI